MRVGRVILMFLALLAAVLAKIPNPYKVLGVPQDANEDQIKAGFKKRSRKYHPGGCPMPQAPGSYSGTTGRGVSDHWESKRARG